MSTTESIFNSITFGKVVAVDMVDKKQFDTLRTGLLRRYAKWAEQFSSMGDDGYKDQYICAEFDKATGVATFQLKPKTESRRKQASYVARLL